jgi:type II secretory pathway pseudopilin PulG
MHYPEAGNSRRTGGLGRARRGEAGFSLIEILFICLLMGIVVGVAFLKIGNSVNATRQRGALATVKMHIANARELAISQQRNIRIEFNAPDQIKVVRLNRPSGETVLTDARLEGGMTFSKLAGKPETPDPWGGDGAVAFGGATSIRFRSGDGALIDQTEALVNGRVFVAHNNGATETAGVISVFGPTGRIRSYRLVGTTWNY